MQMIVKDKIVKLVNHQAKNIVMNQINPKKLLNSKWTAVVPNNRELHFIVNKVVYNPDDVTIVEECIIEAILTNRSESIDWNTLKDNGKWKAGWK